MFFIFNLSPFLFPFVILPLSIFFLTFPFSFISVLRVKIHVPNFSTPIFFCNPSDIVFDSFCLCLCCLLFPITLSFPLHPPFSYLFLPITSRNSSHPHDHPSLSTIFYSFFILFLIPSPHHFLTFPSPNPSSHHLKFPSSLFNIFFLFFSDLLLIPSLFNPFVFISSPSPFPFRFQLHLPFTFLKYSHTLVSPSFSTIFSPLCIFISSIPFFFPFFLLYFPSFISSSPLKSFKSPLTCLPFSLFFPSFFISFYFYLPPRS